MLHARGISVRFGALQALDDVSVSLTGGRVMMLVGPNGAGKSTLMKVLLGLIRPDHGRFEVDGAASTLVELASLDPTKHDS